MKDIYFVRHGESKHNALSLYAGTINSPLTSLGIQQAQKTGAVLKNKNISHIISSNLDRAKHTAIEIQQIISTNHKIVALQSIPELREVHFGDIQNKEIQQIDGLIYGIESGTGDSIDALYKRAQEVIQLIQKKTAAADNILIVGHGAFTAVIFALCKGISKHHFIDYKREWHFDNGEIKKIETDKLLLNLKV